MSADDDSNSKPHLKKFSDAFGAIGEKTGRFFARTRNMDVSQLRSGLRNLDTATFVEWASKTFMSRGLGFYTRLVTVLLCTFFFADLAALFAGRYIPEPPIARPVRGQARKIRTIDDYTPIFTRNLFNSKGLIPGEDNQSTDLGGVPVRTSLPFNLIGTIILRDELRSIATIEDKAANLVYPVRIEDEIPSKARIVKVEARKVVFVNLSSGRREFVDLPEEISAINPRITLGGGMGVGIEQTGSNQFNISRAEVDNALKDLNNILTQARCVPNFENGATAGFKCFQIVPGSIYDKLGLKNDDVIVGVDGQPINDPAAAFGMLNRLKETPHLELQVKRNGRPQTLVFDIH